MVSKTLCVNIKLAISNFVFLLEKTILFLHECKLKFFVFLSIGFSNSCHLG